MATRNPIPSRLDKTKPIYRVTELSYIDDRLLDPATMALDPETEQPKPLLIEYEGEPGYNLEPWNDLAQKRWDTVNPSGLQRRVDPIAELTQIRADKVAA